jgi:2-methylcitrate dehydratase PrpD
VTSTYPATARLADFVATFDGSNLTEDERSVARTGFFDAVGVALAGSAQPAGVAAAALVRDQGATNGAGAVSVWGHGFAAPPALATLANGTSAHALDFDDVNWALVGHPSASLAPTTLALAERRQLSGRDVLDAYACGFEVMTKIGRTVMPRLSLDGGWHATSVIGSIGNAAAAARLLGLDRTQIQHAIGIAVSHSSGVVRNFGSMTKPLHAGLAAQAGIQAAGLAQQGFTAAADAMEGTHGFYSSYGRDLPVDLTWLDKPGEPCELAATGITIKPYPCGVAGHPAIDAAIELRPLLNEGDLERISRLEVHATSYTIDKMRYAWPENELQAKFSLHYQIAKALIDGVVELRHFTMPALDDALARAIVNITEVHLDEEIERGWRANGGSRPCRLVIHIDGRDPLVRQVDVSKGNPGKPLTADELRSKFLSCAAPVLGDGDAGVLADALFKVDQVSDLTEVFTLLRGRDRVSA